METVNLGDNVSIAGKFKNRLKKLEDKWPQYLLAFIFPFLTVISALAIMQCYPFGNKTMLTVDLYHQYAPFLIEFRNKLLSGESLFYTMNDGLGTEYYAAFANYTASPLNIFCVFFNAKNMAVFIGLITAVRAGLASLFMSMFLSENDGKRLDNITVVFACSYALCGWFLTDFWNIMWCDALVFLPLILLGLRKLFMENKWGLYMISLAVSILSNYYAGFFLCLFLVMFAPAYYFMLYSKEDANHKLGIKSFFKNAGKFALASAVSGATTAAVTVPVFLILQNTSATGDEFPVDFNLANNLFDFLGRLMVCASPNIRDGMANVFCGVVVVLMLPLFFMLPKSSGISLRHKFGFGILTLVMYLSFTNRMLNFIWHGFHFPNQIPYRESFIMCFLLVFMAFLTIRRLKTLPNSAISAVIAGVFAYLVLFEKFGEGNEGYLQIGLTLLFLIIQGTVICIITRDNKKSPLFCETILTVTMLVELFVGSTVTIGLVAKNEGFVGYDFYGKNYKQINSYVNQVEGSDGHKTFERSEMYPNNICDIQSVYDVKGMSIFSSTARESFVKYMSNYGFHNNGINGLRNAGLTRVTSTLLGIRNFVEIQETQTVPPIFEIEYEEGEVKSHGNKDALAVGYMISKDILGYEPDRGNTNVFEKTNYWINSMGVEGKVYTPVEMTADDCSNFSTTQTQGEMITYSTGNTEEKSTFEVTISEATLGADVYVYANSNKGGTVLITNGDKSHNFEIRSYQIISLGKFDGNPITLKVDYSKSPSSAIHVYAYELNVPVYDDMVKTLSDEELNVTEYDETSIRGVITATEDGLMLVTIPYAEGWTAKVDGKEVEIIAIADSLIGIELSSGTHEVYLKYVPHGFGTGLAVSLGALFVMIIIIAAPKFPKRKKIIAIENIESEVFEVEDGTVSENN